MTDARAGGVHAYRGVVTTDNKTNDKGADKARCDDADAACRHLPVDIISEENSRGRVGAKRRLWRAARATKRGGSAAAQPRLQRGGGRQDARRREGEGGAHGGATEQTVELERWRLKRKNLDML